MKSPLMDNTDDNMNDTSEIKSFDSTEKKTKLGRNSSRNSISTQTSVNYNLLSPLSVQTSVLSSTHIQSAILCRICYSSDLKESLLQPCDCSGTMGLIHRTCLEKWLSQCNKNQCEICNFNYDVQRKKRGISQWLFRPINNKDSKNLLNDLLCFVILTPLALISTWYCIGFAFKFNESINKWESSGLVILTTFLVIIYFFWLSFSSRYHYKIFKDWQEKNQIVTLNIDKNKIVLPTDLENIKKNDNISKTRLKNLDSLTQTTIDEDSINITDNKMSTINMESNENPNSENEFTGIRRPIYKKEEQNSDQNKVESCVIEL